MSKIKVLYDNDAIARFIELVEEAKAETSGEIGEK